MLQTKIDKLIPFISENFITYPLYEEGNYTPHINVWQICRNDLEYNDLIEKLNTITRNNEYYFDIDLKYPRSKIYEISLCPSHEHLNDGGFDYIKKDWSIEEMIDLLITII